MKQHAIGSQHRATKQPSIATGHTFGKNENIDRAKVSIKKIINIPPALNMYTSTQYTTVRANQIFGANEHRRYLLVQNIGTTTIFIGFGSTPSIIGDNAIELNAGFEISFDAGFCPTNEASAISATQGKLTILEGVLK